MTDAKTGRADRSKEWIERKDLIMKLWNSWKEDRGILLWYFLGYLLLLSILLALISSFTPWKMETLPYLLLYFLGNVLMLCKVLLVKREELSNGIGRAFRRPFRNFAYILLCNLLVYLINVPLALLMQKIGVTNQNQMEIFGIFGQSRAWQFVVIFLALIFAPVVEETVFRGIIFARLRQRGRLIAYAASMTLFSLVHGLAAILSGKPRDMLAIMVYLPLSFMLCRLYEKKRNILASMGLHFLNNGIAVLLMYLMPELVKLSQKAG